MRTGCRAATCGETFACHIIEIPICSGARSMETATDARLIPISVVAKSNCKSIVFSIGEAASDEAAITDTRVTQVPSGIDRRCGLM